MLLIEKYIPCIILFSTSRQTVVSTVCMTLLLYIIIIQTYMHRYIVIYIHEKIRLMNNRISFNRFDTYFIYPARPLFLYKHISIDLPSVQSRRTGGCEVSTSWNRLINLNNAITTATAAYRKQPGTRTEGGIIFWYITQSKSVADRIFFYIIIFILLIIILLSVSSL